MTARRPCDASSMRDLRSFHVRREARELYGVDGSLIGTDGDLVVADTAAIRRLASRMNRAGTPARHRSRRARSERSGCSTRWATCSIDRYEATVRPGAMKTAMTDLERRLGPDARRLLDRFGEEFPGQGPAPEPDLHRLEELLLTRIANENPAVGPLLEELIDDTRPRRRDSLSRCDRAARGDLRRRPAAGGRRPVAHRDDADPGPPLPHLARRPAALHPGELGRAPRAGL